MNGLFYVDLAHRLLGVGAKEAGKEIHIALRQEAVFGDASLNARARNTILESHRDLCIRIRINFSFSFRHEGTAVTPVTIPNTEGRAWHRQSLVERVGVTMATELVWLKCEYVCLCVRFLSNFSPRCTWFGGP